MRKKQLFKRIVAFVLAGVLTFNVAPMGVSAEGTEPYDGMEVTLPLGSGQPDAIDGFVWVAGSKRECSDNLLHSHTNDCYVKTCDHKNGHMPGCYGSSWGQCPGESENHTHTASYEITLSNIQDLKNQPGIGEYIISLGMGALKLYGKTVCYSIDESNRICTHECTEFTGEAKGCYGFKSILEGGCNGLSHEHSIECQYEKYTLYADVNGNGTPDKDDPSYIVKYVNGETKLQESTHLVGTDYPAYTGNIPTKDADAQYTYTFSGWSPELPSEGTKVTASVTHEARFSTTTNTYTVTWKNGNDVIETDENVPYGTKVSYDGATPTKESTEDKVYTFAGWNPEVTESTVVTGDMEFEAIFSDKNVYAVVYNVEGTTPTTKYVIEGEKAEFYEPTREYYELDGWYTDSSYETKFDFETPITEGKEFFAKWKPVNDVNGDNIADEEQVCGITVNGNVTAEVSGNKIPGQTITITATPDAGKYITGVIKVNGNVYETEVTFSETEATFTYALPAGDAADYTFEVLTADATISLYSEFVNWNELMTATEAETSVFENVNWGEMPDPVAENTKVEYLEHSVIRKSWKTIGTDDITPIIGHAFGAKEKETIRFTFNGNDQVPAFTAEFTVSLVDNRLPSKIEANDVTFTYSPSVTEEEMAKAIFDAAFVKVTSADGTVELNAVYGESVFVKDAKVDAGTHTVTIKFSGTSEYADSSAEVTVVIEKADSYVNVSEANVKYGTEVNASALIDTGAAKRVELAVGVSLGENASEDLNSIVYLNLPMIIDTDDLPEFIRPTVDNILSEITSGKEMTISELSGYLTRIMDIVGGLGELGESLGLNIDSTAISALTSVLENLEKIEGIGDVRLIVSMGEDIVLKDAGMYLVGAVVSDSNYNPSFGANYVVITPDGYKAVLDWNVKDENGLITRSAILNGYDFGAKVVEVYEGNIEDAQAHVTTFFMGVDANGEATVTYDPKELQVGVYTQIALIKDFGNTMYYAEPIRRVFAVVPQIAEVTIDNAEVEYDGNEHGVEVAVKLADGSEFDPACLKVTYIGVDVNGEIYNSEEKPVDTGAYAVLATYLAKVDGAYEHAGFDAGVLVITPADAELDVEADAYAIYDGNEHWPEITNTNNLELIKIVADDKGNVNVILPEYYGVEPKELNAKDAVDELVEILKDIYAGNANVAVMAADDESTDALINDVTSKLEAIGVDVYEMIAKAMDIDSIIAEVKERVEKAADAVKEIDVDTVIKEVETTLNGIEVKNLSVNGAGPIEEGVYTVSAIGYGKNYKLATARGSIEIHEHDWIDADCTTPKKCETCKETVGEALGHDWDSWVTTKEPTKKSQGEQRRDCKRCVEYETRSLDKLPSGGGSGSSKNDSGAELEGVYEAPTAPAATTGTSTGDSANILGYVAMIVVAGAALALLFFKKKRA